MKKFTGIHDVDDLNVLLSEAGKIKSDPFRFNSIGKNKTLGLIFLNPSLRTRLSTQKAAMNLGMNVMVMNATQDSWSWEFEDGAVMNGKKTEHIKDAAAVIGQYCDVVAIRCFPSLVNQQEDYSEMLLEQFMKYCKAPVISLESATRHPLQSFADLLTIHENRKSAAKPKVVLTWAPHIKPLPQAVANSFSEWMCRADVDFTIAHPPGYQLQEDFTKGAKICLHQDEALLNADFVYVKSWSSYHDYGLMPPFHEKLWTLNTEKMKLTNNAKIMHCLPVRRNVELCDELIDGENSLIQQQAGNRVHAAQTVLKQILENNSLQKIHDDEKTAIVHY
jgi:N-succinyl-L-ornithine transcarbamylase